MKKLTLSSLLILFTLTFNVGCGGGSGDFDKGMKAYESGDYKTALREWKPLAKNGNAIAQRKLGVLYREGEGVSKDYKTAMKWFRLAAEQGDARAQFNLGLMYVMGLGVIQDNVYAHMWWNIATSSGHKNASTNRDKVAKKMNTRQIEKAQELARECVRKEYKGC